MSSTTTLHKTKNYFRAIGTVYENALVREDCKAKIRDEDGNPAGTVDAERIRGRVSLKTDNGIHTFDVYGQSVTSKNDPNKQWKMYEDMMEWNPQVNGSGDEPTLVMVEGSVAINDYPDDKGEIRTSLRWNVRRGGTNRIPEDSVLGTSLNCVAYIKSIEPEIRKVGDENEDTGRLKVQLLAADNNGACFPINAIITKDMADSFTEIYEVEQTVNFDCDLSVRHVGGAKNAKKAFGKASSVEVNSGFDITELIITGADDPIEEPDELTREDENGNEVEVPTDWINPVVIKKALKARAQMLEELAKNPSKKASGNSSKVTANSVKDAKKKMGGTKPKFIDDDFGDSGDVF